MRGAEDETAENDAAVDDNDNKDAAVDDAGAAVDDADAAVDGADAAVDNDNATDVDVAVILWVRGCWDMPFVTCWDDGLGTGCVLAGRRGERGH